MSPQTPPALGSGGKSPSFSMAPALKPLERPENGLGQSSHRLPAIEQPLWMGDPRSSRVGRSANDISAYSSLAILRMRWKMESIGVIQWFANRRGRFAWPQLCDRPVRYSDTLPTLCSAAPGPVPRYGAPRVSLDSDSLSCFQGQWSPSVFRLPPLPLPSPSLPTYLGPHTPVLAYHSRRSESEKPRRTISAMPCQAN